MYKGHVREPAIHIEFGYCPQPSAARAGALQPSAAGAGALQLALLLCAIGAGCGPAAIPAEPLQADQDQTPRRRSSVSAFYSGHSLSDGVPEAVLSIAAQKADEFDFNFQSFEGALVRERTRGKDPSSSDFRGYRLGRNRDGENMDVQAELRSPRTLAPGKRYDALVITERHDLPYAAYHEATPRYLQHFIEQFRAGNPQGDVLLYHVWLELSAATARDWIAYERGALRMWECVASAVNRKLLATGRPGNVRVLPGGSALAELVEDVLDGSVPGVTVSSPEAGLKLLFRDRVHLSPAGTYFMGALHYAALFGSSPEGAALPSYVPPALGAHMQKLAFRHVSAYEKLSKSAAGRDMGACREFAAQRMCPAVFALRGPDDDSLRSRIKQIYNRWRCARGYRNADDPRNPFS
jgi:hypothetical protein